MKWRVALLLAVGMGVLLPFSLRADDKPDKKANAPKPAASAKVEVPYRLTDTKHLMVRTKINGKGPFHLIIDTGAPAVFVTKNVAKKAKLETDEKEWADIDSFELEGGLKIDKVRARVEDLVQVDGMNSMGLAGVELHGVIGYQVLARFKVEYDLTSDRLVFEKLKFDPPALMPLGGKGGTDIQSMGPMVKALAGMLGIKPNFNTVPRGFTGIEYEEKDGKVFVKRVLPDSPAEKSGLKSGDHILEVKAASIDSAKDLNKALSKAGVGTRWRFTVKRGADEKEIVVELGKGL